MNPNEIEKKAYDFGTFLTDVERDDEYSRHIFVYFRTGRVNREPQ